MTTSEIAAIIEIALASKAHETKFTVESINYDRTEAEYHIVLTETAKTNKIEFDELLAEQQEQM